MKILQLKLEADDLLAMQHFYVEILGFRQNHFDKDQLILQAGDSELIFLRAQTSKPLYHFAFNIPPDQLPQAAEWLGQRTPLIPVNSETYIVRFKTWNAESVFFYDPVGNIAEFIARHDIADRDEDSFSAQSIISISEIGLVCEDAVEATQNIISNYDLGYFRGAAINPDFNPVGNDDGLFLIVKEGRDWYPTNSAARRWPVRVTIQTPNGTHNLGWM